MIRTFGCPSCGGPLEYKSGSGRTIRCSFCHNSIIVPGELREAETAHLRWQPRRAGGARNFILIFVAIAVAIAVSGAVVFFRSARPMPRPAQTAVIPPPALPKPTVQAPAQDSDFASVALTFGSEGIGPGAFKDA